ncbi:hypothetical protein B0H16DRAFT_1687422 [Mycena metata]|uniref:Uncharacterized protein n=1 Tax=Mycena metata TaxID=1033252 RepID=A0AAD7JLW7_9AGAR|nr:hypothetical protein B0H16DRAFT_1687422 [Mycena metata]
MFTNVLAFALGALTLVGAAPSLQTPMLSCNMNFGTTVTHVGAVKGFDGIPPGKYRIINQQVPGSLRSYSPGQPAYVSLTREFPGPFEIWDVEPAGSNSFTISSVGLQVPTYINGDQIIPDNKEPAQYIISAVDDGSDNLFTIQTVDGSQYWGIEPNNPVRPNLQLHADVEGRGEQWLFIRASSF